MAYNLFMILTFASLTFLDLIRIGFFDKRADVTFFAITCIFQAFFLFYLIIVAQLKGKSILQKYSFWLDVIFFICNFMSSYITA